MISPNHLFYALCVLFAFVAWQWWRLHRRGGAYGPEWRARATRYWNDKGRRCRICHGPGEHVHHKASINHWFPEGHEPNWVLLGVCKACHKRIHDRDHWLDDKLGFSRPCVLFVVTELTLLSGSWRRLPLLHREAK